MPAGADGDEESLSIGKFVFKDFLQKSGVGDVGVFLADAVALAVELVGEAFEEEEAEDEFLKLGGVHFAAEDVGGLEEEGFELGEGDFFACHADGVVDLVTGVGRRSDIGARTLF